ncbi:MAG: hypothetical protein ACLFT4_10795 [Bacteroidales bacterium]
MARKVDKKPSKSNKNVPQPIALTLLSFEKRFSKLRRVKKKKTNY